jgi:hypothetical protein
MQVYARDSSVMTPYGAIIIERPVVADALCRI